MGKACPKEIKTLY